MAVSLIEHVRLLYPSLRPSERKVADLFIAAPEFFISATTFDIAVRANVSEATVAKFCGAMGYRGLRELRMKMSGSRTASIAPK